MAYRAQQDEVPAESGCAAQSSDSKRFAYGAKDPITLAGLPVASGDETKHFKIIGTAGTGKNGISWARSTGATMWISWCGP